MAERGVLGRAEGPVAARGPAQAGVSVGPAVDVAALRISGLVCRFRKRRSGRDGLSPWAYRLVRSGAPGRFLLSKL